jgi:hypothetical protein
MRQAAHHDTHRTERAGERRRGCWRRKSGGGGAIDSVAAVRSSNRVIRSEGDDDLDVLEVDKVEARVVIAAMCSELVHKCGELDRAVAVG